ncbi:MAG: GspH/FimT family pseudopilin [Candidatus Binatia bacterium]|nr:GspH/FimT family pseudopilin [Candidatus Binatia bacterium]
MLWLDAHTQEIGTARPSLARARRGWFGGNHGFTLIELSLVLLLLSVVLVAVVPRFRNRERAELLAHAQRLQLTFRFLRNQAVLSGVTYRLHFDLDQQRYWAALDESGSMDLAQFVSEVGSLARGVSLGDNVFISDVALPLEGVKVAQGSIFTLFYPDGTTEPTVIHLATSHEAYTLWFDPRAQRLRGQLGYWEPSYAR